LSEIRLYFVHGSVVEDEAFFQYCAGYVDFECSLKKPTLQRSAAAQHTIKRITHSAIVRYSDWDKEHIHT
jgi:hypothetical protein